MGRGLWFVAGAGTGVYAMVRARRLAEAVTPEGLADRVGALALGARLLADDVRAATATREAEIRAELGLALESIESSENSEARKTLESGPARELATRDRSLEPAAGAAHPTAAARAS
ncbi:hypothetical protein KLP28_00220 [Nocardioidaceae bacterium]|nr:hypothetical protein KLP28_00220 [Nocardioidaceae bacterium]